ncbi:MAG: hypothetical protein WD689_00935 [Gaiellaceae bacterium]
MQLVEQWDRIERGLPKGWGDARLALSVEDETGLARAGGLLGPLAPGRRGHELLFSAAPFGPDHLRRLLRGLDDERIDGTLKLLASDLPAPAPESERRALAESWDERVAALPDDWSDLYCELELTSGSHLERAALLLAPLNPARYPGTPGLRFRVARLRGYGGSGGMARRCLERLDAEGVTGRLEILRALADTQHVATQGPVWRVGGRAV